MSDRTPSLYQCEIFLGSALNETLSPKLFPRVFLRPTLITNKHPSTLRSKMPRKWADLQPDGFHGLLRNAKRQKVPVALALFLQ